MPWEVSHTIQLIESSKNAHYCLDLTKQGELQEISCLSHVWRIIKSIFIGTEKAFLPSNPLAIAEKVEEIFVQYQDKLKRGHSLIFQDFFTALAKKNNPKECASKIHSISQCIFNQVTIQPKLSLVNRAIRQLDTEFSYFNGEGIQEAKKFFVRARTQLNNNRNVPLPEWYHATKTAGSITNILREGQVLRTQAFKGYGAYVSSNDEAGEVIGYGAWTIAFDGEFIERSTASFFVPNPDHDLQGKAYNWLYGWPHASIWARVDQNLPINKKTVAFLVADDEHMPVLKKAVKLYHPGIPKVSRIASKYIFSALTKVGSKRELPYKWQWMDGELQQPLPVVFRN